MSRADIDAIRLGMVLPELALPPVDRTTLALFAGASGDHNPIHIDIDFARRARMPDVFAQGMLGMAWLGRMLTGWCGQARLRSWNVRFTGIVHLGHVLTCRGRVAEIYGSPGERHARVEIEARNQYGETKIVGDAIVALD